MKFLNLKNALLSFTFSALSVTGVNAQEVHKCASTEAHKELIEKHPEWKAKIAEMDAYLNSMDLQSMEKKRTDSTTTYIIPIVFHILHNYGPENISKANILDEIRILNEDFNLRNADTIYTIPQFKNLRGKVRFEFRLPTIDPNGNCTDGIERIYTYTTYKGGQQSKINPWPRAKYFNVWTSNTIGKNGVAAYAHKPADANWIPQYDGVISLYNYISSISPSNPNYSHTLTHEIGHSMNLSHPWGDNNDPGGPCGDDNVSDTPETRGFDYCPDTTVLKSIAIGSTNSLCNAGIMENFQNFMDYSYCDNMFTKGQAERMRNAINSSIAQRNTLIDSLTHVQVGVGHYGQPAPVADCNPVADFNATRRFMCAGDFNTTIQDYSYRNSITGLTWSSVNGAPATYNGNAGGSKFNGSTGVKYDTPGWQSITLEAKSGAKTNTITKDNLIYVADKTVVIPFNTKTEFEDTTMYKHWPMFNFFSNDFKFKIYDGGNTPSGWRAIMFDGFDTRTVPASYTEGPFQDIDEVVTPMCTTPASGYVTFKLASATTAGLPSIMDDTLSVYYSSNCGVSWIKIKDFYQGDLHNNGKVEVPFYPTSTTIWTAINLPLTAGNQNKSNVFFKFRHRGASYSNNLFIDDFSVSEKPTYISPVHSAIEFGIVPNPATSQSEVIINTNNNENITVTVTDMVGKIVSIQKVKTIANQSNAIALPTHVFNTKGIYMVVVDNGNAKTSQKLVVQ